MLVLMAHRYTKTQQVGMIATLLFALAGVLNSCLWQVELFGLSTKQLAIIGFLPVFVVAYFVDPSWRRG
jgi:hypothetical protein